MAAAAEAACGQIHILVNNAGCNVRKPALDVTWDDWNLILDTNLRGSFFVAQQIARRMVPHGYGRIINIGRSPASSAIAGLAPYGASRGGIRQLTMSLADDWGRHGITVNCLAPGWFQTAQNEVLYERPEWVDYLVDRIPAEASRRAARSRRAGRLSRLRGQPLRHRPNAAGRRRHLHRRHPRHRRPGSLSRAGRLLRNLFDSAQQENVARDADQQIDRRRYRRPTRRSASPLTTYPVMIGAAIPESWLEKFTMPPTVPTLPRGAIIDGTDHPTGAAAARPPMEMLIQISARVAVWACAAPRMPSPNAVPQTMIALRTRLASHPRWIRKSASHPPLRSVAVANSHGTPV